MLNMTSLRAPALLLIVLVFTTGCSSGLATVSGSVKIDGVPLKTGTISFKSTTDGALGQGTIDAKGEYTVMTGANSGLKPGSYQVTVVATQLDPPDPARPSFVPQPVLLVPAKYGDPSTSGLTAEIKPGKNVDVNFDLKSM